MRYGSTESDAVAVVRRALDLGVNFFDTAEGYKTESIIAKGIEGTKRDQVVLSTKKGILRGGQLIRPSDFAKGIEQALRDLRTDYIDVYHLHAVRAEDYEFARDEILPLVAKMQREGKVRFVGVTERFSSDPGHEMLAKAADDDCWDVMMVGFNILNQSGRREVFPMTLAKNIGVLIMFAVRRALSRPERLIEVVRELVEQGRVPRGALNPNDPLGFLLAPGRAGSMPEAGYRFCRWEPPVHVVLTGTGSIEHLEENVESILKPALPSDVVERLSELFQHVDNVSGA
jgi:aryl-alcohol dehydrogenase-like predicted oxidoreductase